MIILSGAGTVSIPGPSSIEGAWEFWEPRLEGLANNASITQLTGQISPGTGHNFVAAGCAGLPTYVENVLNGQGVARFNGEHCLGGVDPSVESLTAAHIFAVVKTDAELVANTMWKFGTDIVNVPDLYNWVDGKIYDSAFSTLRRDCGNPTPVLTDWRVVEIVSTSSEWTYLLDGVQQVTDATNTVGLRTSLILGANTTRNLVGHIAGVYIFAQKLTTGRAAMVDYLNDPVTGWGLSIV